MIGKTIGAYAITAKLGQGGMGEVYRAHDAQLKRDVAIKILPADVSADPERLARFQREAEILASLNHANIAQVFGIAESNGVRGIVMELVEGLTLAHTVALGPLPLNEALGIARQIAEALETAHDRGVVHRDLKPANIVLTPDGVVKVLDFGLAKALSPPTDAAAQAATFSSPAMTRAGIILGTAAYMSPEQARGRVVDARTDIWAFGCVLFEMLTGRRAFDGETVTDILGAIVHKEPDWNLLPATLPESLRRVLERCLAKDQKQRLHNIADVRLEIQDLLTRPRSTSGPTAAVASTPSRAGVTTREGIAWVLAAASLIAAMTAVWLLRPTRPELNGPQQALRLSFLPTEGGEVLGAVISPDGRKVAYSARRADGMPLIWVRDLAQSTPRPLAGTEQGSRAFWSPDSRQLGFAVDNMMKRLSADGGPVHEISRNMRVGASWGANDVVIFHSAFGTIRRIDASGGTETDVTRLPGSDWDHLWPAMLPDGRHFLFTAKHWAGLAEAGDQGIYLGSLADPSDQRQLLPDLSSAVYTQGYIVFARAGQLTAVRFDLDSLRITGEPIPLGEAVAGDGTWYYTAVSAATDGTLAVRPPPAPVMAEASAQNGSFEGELAVLKRDGSLESRFGGTLAMSYFMAASHDGRSVVVDIPDTRTSAMDLWRIDVGNGARMALTTMRSSGGYAGAPVWSPDDTRLAFACQPAKTLDDICIRDMRSGAVTTEFSSPATWEHPRDWSSDGQYLLVSRNLYQVASRNELHVWSMKTRTITPYVTTTAGAVSTGLFSPDGKFVAFSSSETGRIETYVTTFPDRRQTWPLTTDGGTVVSWRADGKEVLVATLSGHIAAYPVDTTSGVFSAGPPKILIRDVGFDAPFVKANRDHSRIFVRIPKDAEKDHGEIRLLFGWAKGLAATPR